MTFTYTLFKFLHVVAAMLWIGGIVAVGFLNARLARSGDRAALTALVRESETFGKKLVGPATGVTLLAGIVMMVVAKLGFSLWILWGFGAMIASGALGGAVIRRHGQELSRLMASGGEASVEARALQQRIRRLSMVNLLLLLSAVWMMVFKHTL